MNSNADARSDAAGIQPLRSSIRERLEASDRGRGLAAAARATRMAYERLLKGLDLPPGAAAASLSCGFGNWDYITLKAVPRIGSIVATDIVNCPVTGDDVKLLNSLASWRFEKAEPEQPLPLESSSFDLVFHHDVIEHVRKPGLFMRESHRILKTGGYLVFSTPNLLRPANILRLIAGRLRFPFKCDPVLLGGEVYIHGHVQEFTSWTLTVMCEEAGFSEVSVTPCYFGIHTLGLTFAAAPLSRAGRAMCHDLVVCGRK